MKKLVRIVGLIADLIPAVALTFIGLAVMVGGITDKLWM